MTAQDTHLHGEEAIITDSATVSVENNGSSLDVEVSGSGEITLDS